MSEFRLKIIMIVLTNDNVRFSINKLTEARFKAGNERKVGVDILKTQVEFESRQFATLNLWDLKLEPQFAIVKSSFFKGAAGAIIFIDLAEPEVFEKAKELVIQYKESTQGKPFFALLGLRANVNNTIDKGEMLSDTQSIQKFAEENGGFYFDVSLNDVQTIVRALEQLTRSIVISRR